MKNTLHQKPLCGIYAIVNRANGCTYIGQSRHITKRLENHKKHILEGKHPNQRLNQDLKKYNADHFEFRILKQDIEPKDLNKHEYDFIRSYYRQGVPLYNIAGTSIPFIPARLTSGRTKSIVRSTPYGSKRYYKPRRTSHSLPRKRYDHTYYGFPKDLKAARRYVQMFLFITQLVIYIMCGVALMFFVFVVLGL